MLPALIAPLVMPKPTEALDLAIEEVARARTRVQRIRTKQVRGVDDIASLKATADTWFHSHRPELLRSLEPTRLAAIDNGYGAILSTTSKSAARSTYLTQLKELKNTLVDARGHVLVSGAPDPYGGDSTSPDFSPLVGNEEMRGILTRRWHECRRCVQAEAHLAGIVMMGGLLEAMFVARANALSDKRPLIGAASAPKDKSGTVLNYQEWKLDSYIKVATELKWITESAGDLADVLKEYRNYVHPEKERRHGVVLALNDSTVFWQLTKALVHQLLMSARGP